MPPLIIIQNLFQLPSPCAQALRQLVQVNPQILQPMLQELGKQNPQLLQQINNNQVQRAGCLP